jgi:acetyl-CoA carboxylase, biotin carboxylase subunit
MELNARIQVEHAVSEMLTGIDLVREQIRVSAGLPLPFRQSDIVPRGAAIECRINAEDPARAFAPAPGRLDVFEPPAGPWTRVDTGYRTGDRIPVNYDSLLAKVIVWAPDRTQAIARMDRALAELDVQGRGVFTTATLHRAILRHPEFVADEHTVQFLDQHLSDLIDRTDAVLPSTVQIPPVTLRGVPAMPSPSFTLSDLMTMLTTTAGLDPAVHTSDPEATLEDVGLDSLAFLALQTELINRFGFELDDDVTAQATLGEMAAHIDTMLGSVVTAEAS